MHAVSAPYAGGHPLRLSADATVDGLTVVGRQRVPLRYPIDIRAGEPLQILVDAAGRPAGLLVEDLGVVIPVVTPA